MSDRPEANLGDRTGLWVHQLIKRYPILENCRESIVNAFWVLKNTFQNGGKLLVCGNGGSAADAEHICGELAKGFLKKRPLSNDLKTKFTELTETGLDWVNQLQQALPALPLTINGVLATATGNDQAPDLIFAQQVLGYGKANDTLIAISTSGHSPNVIKAVWVAKALNIHTIGLTGQVGGKLKELCEVVIPVPATQTYEIQELHLPVYHTLCAMLEEEFF
jgi:D-sedoheptulose 7-phosphate isomerase